MEFTTEGLFKEAKEIIEANETVVFVDDIVSKMGCNKSAFYKYIPATCDEMKDIRELLYQNKVSIKTKMRKKWFDSTNPTLQIGLMKLIGTDEERKKLSPSYVEANDDETEVMKPPTLILKRRKPKK